MQCVPEPGAVDLYALPLKAGERRPPAAVLDWLDRAGYTRADAIEQPGDFAARGGVLDIYAPTGGTERQGPVAVRLDYFGDEIESLRLIDTDTMASGASLPAFRLIGANTRALQHDEHTLPLMAILPHDVHVVLAETMELAEQARGYFERLTDPRGIIAPNTLLQRLTRGPHVEVHQFASPRPGAIRLPVTPLPSFAQDASQAVGELLSVAGGAGLAASVVCRNPAERDRLSALLAERGGVGPSPQLEVGYLHRGFVWEHRGVAHHVVPHHELFHRYQTSRRVRKISAGSRAGDAFLDLQPGDCVVHEDHGIARFLGLKTLKREGRTEDFVSLEFARKALLHVPVAQVEKVQKYIGGHQGRPPLSLLGGKRWGRQKEQARGAVKDLAKELLRVQAARAAMPGVRYPADTAWQREFEAEFPYEETEDQLAAMAEIKKDMSDPQPMDRLVCGDVGFGKTELAIRAAFKAAEYGKQVAVLVPTTVLAEQHERTFRDRMADYPFRIASLSRFKSASEQREVLDLLAKGQVDIVIGTHRLLSQDVRFADLGLVVIDEEQRFGVEHKQRLLQFRMTADVLTLSATPIPRTLHMSMLGLRDISSLSTPPADRRAVVTEVMAKDLKRLRRILARELSREGQVYFVHNRVHDIHATADEVRTLAPGARVIVGHGQMTPAELEEVMLRFMRRDADILVSTTIIESGIDNPAANTMVIDDADMYGLADLHQLRGRVGRYKHRAYCYLLLPQDRPVTDKAARRLRAIEQFAMLGAGFKIAMRDLEIRGAGNLLGPEQSGHIAAVGYQMYCQLLDDEARRLRHDDAAPPVSTHLELPVQGRLLPSYIPSEKQRLDAYRRLSRSANLEELNAVVRGVVDAYGKAPAVCQAVFDLAELRVAAGLLGIERVKLEGPDLIFTTRRPRELEPLLAHAPGRASLLDDHTVYYRPPPAYLAPPATLLAVLRKLLVRPLAEAVAPAARGA
jgi:transcription-repair coupling factor (superfamily II helicase)